MKFVISTQELIYLVSKCLNVVPLKTTIPILQNLLIEAVNDELILTATDLTVGVRCFTEAKIIEEGSTTISARRLANLIKELTAANIEISTNSLETMEILADSSRFKLNGMNKAEFPELPALNEAYQLRVKQADLKEMLYRTSFAVSREDNRYALTGVSLNIINRTAIFAGTDGKRLARAQMEIDVDPDFHASYIIPLKAVEEIQKNLLEEGDALVFLMKDKIAVQANQTMIITKLLTGEYPDINRVIPQNSETQVVLHRDELMTLLRQISLFTTEASNSVRFTLADGELKLSANTMDIGEGKVSMPANYQGNKLEIAFNPGFFIDILRHSKAETISLAVTDAYNPGVITDDNKMATQTSSPLFVLMPMRLNEE
jgi:DNA polymerase III subunit beta